MNANIIWLGHAALSLSIGGHELAVDPYLTGNPAASRPSTEGNPEYILVSHGHVDHVGDALAMSARTGATIIANSEICHWLTSRGAAHTHPQQIGGVCSYPFGRLKLTQAIHGSSMEDGAYGGLACGFLLEDPDGKKIYIAGDTGLFGDMLLIGEEGVDLAALPIGGNFTMDPDDALRAVRLLRPKLVLPYHYGTWEIIAQDAAAWKKKVEGETATRVLLLQPGESFSF
jgi:L-ascorbate metabolism protein UlaG (beta-lactamase superfamily)